MQDASDSGLSALNAPNALSSLAALSGVPFTKMTGSGNDFVVFNVLDISRELVAQPEVIEAICSRHNGIGADGVVLLESRAPQQGSESTSPIRLTYYNRDGTLGELCGNATLCSTSFAILNGLARPDKVQLETDAGLVSARLAAGQPQIDLAPVERVEARISGISLEHSEHRIGFALVGVPHVVILTDSVGPVDVHGRGRPIRQHEALGSAGANVNWIAPLPDGRWEYRTYERGVEAETLACGTGAVASAILLTEWQLAEAPVRLVTRSGRELVVELSRTPGGAASGGRWLASLRGEGRVVFSGSIAQLG